MISYEISNKINQFVQNPTSFLLGELLSLVASIQDMKIIEDYLDTLNCYEDEKDNIRLIYLLACNKQDLMAPQVNAMIEIIQRSNFGPSLSFSSWHLIGKVLHFIATHLDTYLPKDLKNRIPDEVLYMGGSKKMLGDWKSQQNIREALYTRATYCIWKSLEINEFNLEAWFELSSLIYEKKLPENCLISLETPTSLNEIEICRARALRAWHSNPDKLSASEVLIQRYETIFQYFEFMIQNYKKVTMEIDTTNNQSYIYQSILHPKEMFFKTPEYEVQGGCLDDSSDNETYNMLG